jgi:hypothetical protein
VIFITDIIVTEHQVMHIGQSQPFLVDVHDNIKLLIADNHFL